MHYTPTHEFLSKMSKRNYSSKREYDAEYKRLKIDVGDTHVRNVYNDIIRTEKNEHYDNSQLHVLLLYAAIMAFIYIYIQEPLDLSYYSLCLYCAYEFYTLPPRLDDSFKFYTNHKLGIVNTIRSHICCVNELINWSELREQNITRIEFLNTDALELWKSCGNIAAINIQLQDIHIHGNNVIHDIYKPSIYRKETIMLIMTGIGLYGIIYHVLGTSYNFMIAAWFIYIMKSEYELIKKTPDEHIRYNIENPIFLADEWNVHMNMNLYFNDRINHPEFPWIKFNNSHKEIADSYSPNVKIVVHEYSDSTGTEYFISSISEDRQHLYGFIRMRINNINNGTALIREIKTYRTARLMDCAESIASQNNTIWKLTLIDNSVFGHGFGFKYDGDAGCMTKKLRQ